MQTGNSVTLPKLMRRDGLIRRICLMLESLPMEKAWQISVEEAKSPRSLSQNALLWALYGQIIQKGGEAMQGWTKDDLHSFFLGNFHGWDKVKLFNQTRLRPLGRSKNLSKTEFADYVDSIVRFMAERGVVLDLPDSTYG
jgi:hypothetical protein